MCRFRKVDALGRLPFSVDGSALWVMSEAKLGWTLMIRTQDLQMHDYSFDKEEVNGDREILVPYEQNVCFDQKL